MRNYEDKFFNYAQRAGNSSNSKSSLDATPPPFIKEDNNAKRSKAKIIFIVFGCIILLAGAGICIYLYLNRSLEVTPETVTMESEGGACSFQVKGPSNWEVQSTVKPWLYYTREDQTLIFTCNENSSYRRGDTIRIGNGRKSCRIVILQESGVFTSDNSSKRVSGGGGTVNFYIYGQDNWSIEESPEDWGSAYKDNNTLVWRASENSGDPRGDMVVLVAGRKKLALRLYQDGALRCTENNITVSSSSGRKKIAIYGPSEWHCNSNQYWISTERSGDSLIIEYDKNDDTVSREGTVTVSGGGQSISIEVKQNGKSSSSSGYWNPGWGWGWGW